MKRSADNGAPAQKPRSRLLWSVLFVLIAAATIWAVSSQARAFSLDTFVSYIAGASKPWLTAAVLCVLGYIWLEGEAILTISRAFGYPAGRRRGLVYSASDIYFSAITPSATGGQPACAYFMMKDGIPGSVTTVVLLTNLTMYTITILVLGVLTALAKPELFAPFSLLSRVLIVLGYFIQGFFTAFLLLLLTKSSLLHKICGKGLRLLCKLRLLRHEEEKRRRLDNYIQEYRECARMIKEHKGAMIKAFILNLLQRVLIITVPLFVFLASGGAAARSADIWAVQCYTVLGANAMPIPGAMGISDYIMLDGFGKLMPYQDVVSFELLSRSVSFYICVVLCGITALIAYLLQRKREANHDRIL